MPFSRSAVAQIADLLNGQNQLTVRYTPEMVLETNGRVESEQTQSVCEIDFPTRKYGTPQNIRELLDKVIQAANSDLPFGFRLDFDGDFYTFVPTRTRDSSGASIEVVPLLDRHVTIPSGSRGIAGTANLMADALAAQIGKHVSCCQALVTGIRWGMGVASFEAQDEPARSVLERLIKLDQATSSFSSRYSWVQVCDATWCSINLKPVWGGECRGTLHLLSPKRLQ